MDQKARECVIDHLDSIAEGARAFQPQKEALCVKNGIHPMQGKMFGIDGNIGSGKSYLGKTLEKAIGPRASFIKEYVCKMWLDMLYENEKQWAGVFQINQMRACITSTKLMMERCEHGAVGIIDRTLMGNLAFALVHERKGNIDEKLMGCYKKSLIDAGPYPYADIIFLSTEVEAAKIRIDSRAQTKSSRESEKEGVPLGYLRQLDEMMLFVALYLRATGNARVSFWDWTEFGEHRQILKHIAKNSLILPTPDKELLQRIKRADYQTLKTITQELCENINKKI